MRLVCATHGHCFDGMASAVAFTRLVKSVSPEVECEYRGCGYGIGQQRPDEQLLSGDENAILDYRFHPAKSLTWYFDHHRTAFACDADRAVFEGRRNTGRYFFDPEYSSCTQLIADVGERDFGVGFDDLSELVHWADVVDAARFESAQQAIDRSNPVMRFVSVVEHFADDRFLQQFVPQLLERPLIDVASSRAVQDLYRPLGRRHERFVSRVRERSHVEGRVVFVDLTDTTTDVIGKFVTYALFPQSVYSVVVGLLSSGIKISVGYNPWSGKERDADISAICARWGGGGHPVVGGISFRKSELDHARGVAREIVQELAG